LCGCVLVPDPKALAVANWLRSQNLKPRTCIMDGQRKDMFKGELVLLGCGRWSLLSIWCCLTLLFGLDLLLLLVGLHPAAPTHNHTTGSCEPQQPSGPKGIGSGQLATVAGLLDGDSSSRTWILVAAHP
jgi:hypothetical protein